MIWALLLAGLGPCHAERQPLEGLPSSLKALVGRTEELAPCSVAALPEAVRRALAEADRQRELVMVDPDDASWNSSDVGGGPKRRLARAAHSPKAWIVDFWKGGFAVRYRVVVIGVDGDAGRILWNGSCHRKGGDRGKWQCEEQPPPPRAPE